LFALRNGLLVAGDVNHFAPTKGPFGTTAYGLDDMSVSLRASMVAAVADGRTTLLDGPVSAEGTATPIVSGATDLLRPAWDFSDRLWVVDRTAAGALVSTINLHQGLGRPVGPQAVTVPGITGKPVKAFLVSRDGSRLVAVVRGPEVDEILVSRIRHDPQGNVIGAGRAVPLATANDIRRVRDIGWRTPTSVAVLHRFTRGVVQVVSVPVDGSVTREDAFSQRQRARALVTSPVDDEVMYTMTPSALLDPTGVDSESHSMLSGITVVHYPG
jgi:hypothetical protein